MIDIDKIPGFEKTPEEVNTFENAIIIFKMVNLKIMHDIKELTIKLKKLLDDRRELLQACIGFLKYMKKEYAMTEIKKIFDTVEKITGKTWEELNDR